MSIEFLQVGATETSLRAPTTSATAFGATVALGNGALVVDTNGAIAHKAFPADGTAATVLSNGNTINSSASVVRVSASAITGLIIAPGTRTGQRLTIINVGAGSATFAATGTSNVADGASAVIATLTRMTLYWDALSAKWYHGN